MNKVWDPGTLYYRGKQPEGITPPAMSNLWSSEQWPCVMEKNIRWGSEWSAYKDSVCVCSIHLREFP